MSFFQPAGSTIKLLILKFFEFFGYKLKGIKKIVQHNNFDSIQKFIINEIEKKNHLTIFDVGANVGQSIDRFRDNFKNSAIYSFEPSKKIFEILKRGKSQENNHLFNLALSDKSETKVLNSYEYHHINSFYKLEENSKFELSRKFSSNESEKFNKKEEVKCISLDEFVEFNSIDHIDILKIDTQGSEPEVLKGAENFLKMQKVSLIEIELIIGVAYERRLSFYDLEKILNKYGYKLVAISEGGNIISYSSYQVDLIYVNQNIFKKIVAMDKKNLSIHNVMKKVTKSNKSTY